MHACMCISVLKFFSQTSSLLKLMDCGDGLSVRASATRAGGRGFNPWPGQIKVFKKLVVVTFPLSAQDYGNSTTSSRAVSG